MLNEVWTERRLALTTLAAAAACLCYVVVLNKHCHTRVRIYTYLCTHTEAGCSCVLVRSRPSLCGLVGFSNTHALCLCCAQRPPVVWPHTICLPSTPKLFISYFFFFFSLCLFHITPKHLPSCLLNTLHFRKSFNISILHKNYVVFVCLGCRHRGGACFGQCPGHRFTACSFVLRAVRLSCLNLFLNSLSHPVNLSFPQSPRLPPNSLSGASHFAAYCWKPASLRGSRPA